MALLTWAGLAFAAVLLLLWHFRARMPKGLSGPDGSFEPFFGITRVLLRDVMTNGVPMQEFGRRLLEKNDWKAFGFGHLGGRCAVYLADPDDVRFVLRDSFNSFEKGPNFLAVLQPLLGDGIFNSNGAVWRHQRTATAGLFSLRKLRERMCVVFGTHAFDLSRAIGRHAESKQPFDLQDLFYRYTFDAISRIAFNQNINTLSGGEADMEFQTAFDVAQHKAMLRFAWPWWRLNKLVGQKDEREFAAAIAVVDKHIERVVDSYFAPDGSVRPEVLEGDHTIAGLLLQHMREEGIPCTRQMLRDTLTNTMIAGRDTTASALTSAVELLSAHPDWQDKVHAEAVEIFGTSGDSEPLGFDDIENKSPVAEAVLFEVMRLHPPVPMNEKVATQDVEFPSGFKLYAGEYVSFAPYSLNRNPRVWGEDAAEFKPERWMNGRAKDISHYMYPTFNAGPRLCLGREMALVEARIVLLTLARRFQFALAPGFTPQLELAVTWKLKNGLQVRACERCV